MLQAIVNADDLGISRSTNAAIAQAHRHGILTSASLMATGPEFDDAVCNILPENPALGVGLHLNLTSGRSVLPPQDVPLLVDDRGRFRHGFGSLMLLTLGRSTATEQIRRELNAQFERLTAAGVKIDHVDGHRHFHMIPAIFTIVTDLCRHHGCPRIRISHEPWPTGLANRLRMIIRQGRNLPKKFILSWFARHSRRVVGDLLHPDHIFGILDSGLVDSRALKRILTQQTSGIIEIITHPGLAIETAASETLASEIDAGDQPFLASRQRQVELSALQDPDVVQATQQLNIRLIRYADLPASCETTGVVTSGAVS